jgi:RNA polymerase sigma factor (sigma-70 family)
VGACGVWGGAAADGVGGGAEEVTQAVFLVMARKRVEGKLPEERFMVGWLLRVTRFAVKEARRSGMRRRYHEGQAGGLRGEVQEAAGGEGGAESGEALAVRRELDEALMGLGAMDREVVTRRYLQGQAVGEVAAAVGMSENTAGRRISRALEKLRVMLGRRGISAPPGAVMAVLAEECGVRAPEGLVKGLSGMGVAGGVQGAVQGKALEIGNGVLRRMVFMKTVTATVAGVAILLACVGVAAVGLRMQNRAAAPVAKPAAVPMVTAWDELKGDDMRLARGLLSLYGRPAESVPFLKVKMRSIKVDEGEVKQLAADLGSGEERVWRPVYERLYHLDPRVAMELPRVVELTQGEPARQRLVDALGNSELDFLAHYDEKMERDPDGKFYVVRPSGFRFPWSVERTMVTLQGRSWGRAKEALVVLSAIGTPEAKEIVAEMASGDPKVEATQFAKVVLERMEKGPAGALRREEMDGLWDDLTKHGQEASAAMLRLAQGGEETVAFLRTKVLPMRLSEEEANRLLGLLSSEREEEWRGAFEKLDYFDPRLVSDVPALMEQVKEPRARARLADILTGHEAGDAGEGEIKWRRFSQRGYSVTNGKWTRFAETWLDTLSRVDKKKWLQVERGIAVLGEIGSAEAVGILREMSRGHQDAEPTRVAVEELERRGVR